MSYDSIKLERGFYSTEKSFTQTLEDLDPSENYKGTALEGLDAFERQLKRFDIKVTGQDSDTVSKFFKTTDAAVLFPEYLSRAVNAGILGNDKVESIIATTTKIDSLDYRSIKLDESVDKFYPEEVGEGNPIPELAITANSSLTELKKFGKMISASYEAIKFQKLDIFSLTLRRIGESISNCMFNEAISAIPFEKCETVTATGTEFTYEDFVKLWLSFGQYEMSTIICNKNVARQLLLMPEFRDANAGLDFHGTGKLITPFGAEIICFEELADNDVIGLDKRYAIERVIASDITTDYDKVIDKQLERATISTIVGFSPILNGAVKHLQIA